MQELTLAIFMDRFGSAFNEATIAPFFDNVVATYPCYYARGVYGTDACTNEIILQLVAHLIVLETTNVTSTAPNKTTTNQSVGSVSVGYGGDFMNEDKNFYATTKYGQRFWKLISKYVGAIFV